MNPREKARTCLNLILERKAVNPVVLEVGKLTTIADYFLIASGTSSRQVQAIAHHLQTRMKEEGFTLFGAEGEREGQWVLLDYGDLVVHLFYEPIRKFYDLEGLWTEAHRIDPETHGDELQK